MNKQIRKSKFTKVLACYLAMMILLQVTAPFQAYALTEGPSQPEFNSFTPIGTSDMVDLTSGDFNYNIPIMDVGGYPINLAYNSGVTMDQEASWVGLGWNLNVGQINRNVRGLPDDFNGDIVETDNNLKTNITVGVNPYINAQLVGLFDKPNMGLSIGAGLDVQYNNYYGFKATPSFGASFKMSEFVSAGMQLSSSVEDGVSVSPSISISAISKGQNENQSLSATISPSITYNSRQGLQSFNLSSSIGYVNGETFGKDNISHSSTLASSGSSYSFINNTFTPTKRLAFKNNNLRFSFSVGIDLWGGHGEVSVAGYGSVQKLIDSKQFQNAYGYQYTDYANEYGLLDFNREKEQGVVSKRTLVLPVTNYTYDLYTIQGQGVSGMFRPFRGQTGFVHDSKVVDQSSSSSFGLEGELGAGGHLGANFRNSISTSYSGKWETAGVVPFLEEKTNGNLPDYEKVYFKNIGETRVDEQMGISFLPLLRSSNPITLKLDANKDVINVYREKYQPNVESMLTEGTSFNTNTIKRANRELRNQVVQKFTKGDVKKYGLQSFINYNSVTNPSPLSNLIQVPLIPDHHTAGYVVTDENGNRNIYGETAVNKEKKEVAFNIGNPSGANLDLKSGQAKYSATDNTTSNSKGIDNYFNSIKTPAYAHTYLLTSILSSDYSDLTNDGPTDDDLGSYTKFVYKNQGDYKWRVPYGKMNNMVSSKVASYNEGLKTNKKDQKGSYLYGVKENKYLRRIETKTHVAFIDLEKREDGVGVSDENGGGGVPSLMETKNQMYRIKSIRLYSKPEAIRGNLFSDKQIIDYNKVAPIKTAHFEYDYSLCQGIDNNFKTQVGQKGKLTLKKVYFTYGNSNMGKFAPYRFDYKQTDTDIETGGKYNPDYNVKGYDIWGNYKEFILNSDAISSDFTTPQEFPYVDQTNRELQNVNAAAWTLHAIDLPSGGRIEVEFEADDYKFVQDKKAMQMFKIKGVTQSTNPNSNYNDELYDGLMIEDAKYVVVGVNPKVKPSLDLISNPLLRKEFIIKKYTDGLNDKPIYFNFLVNMTDNSFEYVSGYFEMDGEAKLSADENDLFIPMKFLNIEGKSTSSSDLCNPISVAGWFFGRQNLNREVFDSMSDPQGNLAENIVDIGRSIVDNLGELINIFNGANTILRNKGCAKKFKPNKSWIRLNEPTGSKIGGGSRVKKVVLLDQWDKMLDLPSNSDLSRYAKKYGQQYDYDLEDGTSSGVATYEPNISKENPLIVPFYHKKERLTEQTYQEKPFGESFFPSATVTYSEVSVSNITASDSKSTTGKVVTQHYTSYDFPTRTDFTNLDKSKQFYSNEDEVIGNMLKGMLSMKVKTQVDLTMTQGFVIETNDMNGKLKKQEVYNNNNDVISSVEYKYATQEANAALQIKEDKRVLDNRLPVVSENGTISKAEIGTHYDVVNDLRESYSQVNSSGLAANVDFIPFVPIPFVLGWASVESSENKQILRTAVTTKIIHKTGILKEKIAFDLGSIVYTKNQAWDAKTGQVLLTETVNEFDDKYYSFNFPAYWKYKQMGMASENVDIQGTINPNNPIQVIQQGTTKHYFKMLGIDDDTHISRYLKVGDEIGMYQGSRKFWVESFTNNSNGIPIAVRLINANGQEVSSFVTSQTFGRSILGFNTKFRVIRSGNRNNQMASMASITLMRNPITTDGLSSNLYKGSINNSFVKNTSNPDPKIINASAIEYEDFWEAQCENGLRLSTSLINKYVYNIKGLWRPVKSYAYLTGRNSSSSSNIRSTGYFATFNPFYILQSSVWKRANNYSDYWTYASEVTKYNPYGVEVENKDALHRYSSAQYGYRYKLPVAVASNSQYKEMGFDGFEDYEFSNWQNPSNLRPHFGFNEYINSSQGSSISEVKSHTGKKSILVKSYEQITITRELKPCE